MNYIFVIYFLPAGCLLCVQPVADADYKSRYNNTASDVLTIAPDGIINVVVNGRTISAYSSPGMPTQINISKPLAVILFGPEAAQITDVKKKVPFISISSGSKPGPTKAKVGPIRINGTIALADVTIHGLKESRKLFWYEQDKISKPAAMWLGPHALPNSVIHYMLRDVQLNEVTFSLPMISSYAWWLAATEQKVGNKNVTFALAPQYLTSIASAAAGTTISRVNNGKFTGEKEAVLITHDVKRPARMLILNKPFKLGNLKVSQLYVRTTDYGDTSSITESHDYSREETNEIIVEGKRKSSKAEYIVYLGNDALQDCSSITYDKKAKLIYLSCLKSDS